MKISWKNIHYIVIIAIILNFFLLYYLKQSSNQNNNLIISENTQSEILNNETTIFLKKKDKEKKQKKSFPETKINPNDSVSQIAENIGAQGKVPQTAYLLEKNITNNTNNNVYFNEEKNNIIDIFLGLFSIIFTIVIINFLIYLGERKKKQFSNSNHNSNNIVENPVTNYILMDEEELK